MRNHNKPVMNTRPLGFSLIEVLITLLVFSIGLLGVAALQTLSKQSNFEASQRTVATLLSYEIIERMRSNPLALGQYVASGANLGGGSIGAEPAPGCSSSADICTHDEIAIHDLWEWEEAIDGASETVNGAKTGGLVNPTGCISGPPGGGAGTYTVAIAWHGTTVLSNQNAGIVCGAGKYGANEQNRRLLVINTFITPPI